jgi:thiamine biosynthesis lipoprotein
MIAPVLIISSLLFAGFQTSTVTQPEPLSRFTYTQYHMGVDARVTVYAKNEQAAEDACAAAFSRIAQLEAVMSDYRRDSELMRLCDQAGGPPVKASLDLFKVLTRAREVSERSNGAFDVTVGPLIQIWRPVRRSGTLPDLVDIRRAKLLVGWRNMNLDWATKTVRLTRKGMRLDLGGIGKGYAADEAQRVLKKRGITRAMVEMGGDIVVSGPPPGTKGWTIRVPNAGDTQGPIDLQFANCGISTSGDTEQFVVVNGIQYSHVVDPRTGMALTNRIQATVVAKDGFTSDPLSTALTVIEPSQRGRFLNYYKGAKVYLKTLAPK